MRRVLILASLLFSTGCISNTEWEAAQKKKADAIAEANAKQEAILEEKKGELAKKVEWLKTKKILNIRMNDSSFDFIIEDGTIITIEATYTGGYRDRDYPVHTHLQIK